MKTRPLGACGLSVSIVGLGAGALGDLRLSDDDARDLVFAALDRGVTLFDTAKSYGASEERLGRLLGPRRKDVVVATKGGYGVCGVEDWTPDAIRQGIDGALARLRTDVVDVFFFHSCPMSTLARDDLLRELDRAKRDGKIRLAGYSGENDELAWAAASGRFDVLECSVSFLDRASLSPGGAIATASARGVGVVAKRALANAPWRFADAPEAWDLRVYWERLRAMDGAIDPARLGWPELAMRFAAHAPGVAAALVGTRNPAHLADAIVAAERGPLDADVLAALDAAWAARGAAWGGVV